MRRRKLVALVSAFTLLAIVFIAIAVIGVGVGTDPGRDAIRGVIQRQIEGQVKGKIYLGKAGGGLLRGFTLDSFAIRDEQDSLLVSTGKVSLDYDPRDLMDRRLLLRNVTVERPVIRLRQHANGDWNFERIFRRDGPKGPSVPGRSFGDFIVLDSVRVKNGELTLTRPWEPDDTLSGARRDSAIRRNLTNPNRIIRRSAEGLTHTYRWTRINGFLPHVRLAHPDSNRFGREFHIANLSVEEFEPPFSFRNGRGVVRQLGDSIFLDVAHFDLPASTGSAKGRIWWGSGLPVRVDVNVVADSVSLSDIAWVYETLPRTGVGRTKLRIRNVPYDLRHFQYELTEMDVRSTRSRLLGSMTFVTGQPVLGVTDVDLRAAPVNFDLVRTLAGGPLSVDWQGDLFGHVKGPGGPLTDFVVEESDVTWQDAHVRGAMSRGSARGTLDILDPEYTKFKAFDVTLASLDLRSIQYLFPDFLRLGGTVAGTARLDSLWLDVRFSNANVTHRNGPGAPTRVTGSGRVTWAEDFMRYDLSVNAQPVSLTMLSRAYPLNLKGLMSGPVRAFGTTDSLQVRLDLAGPAGRIMYEGRVDAYPLSVAAFGAGRLDSLRLDQLVDADAAPAGSLSGPYELRIRADTNDLGTLRGSAAMFIERGTIDGMRVFPSRIHATFADRRMRLDTLRFETIAATVTAAGSLGIVDRATDSLSFRVTVDSLGGLRRYVTRLTSAFADSGSVAGDSLAGTIVVDGRVTGSLLAPDVSGTLAGTNMFVRREAGRVVEGRFALQNVLAAPTGTASLRIDALNVGGIALDTLGATVRLEEGRGGQFRLSALARNGVTMAVGGDLALNDIRNEFVVRELAMTTDSSRWMLRAPASVYTSKGSFAVDSLVLVRNRGGGYLRLSGTVPESGPARILFRADSVPLRDVGQIAQLNSPFSGMASLTLQGAGTLTAPVMNLQATLDDIRYGGLRAQRLRALAEYRDRRTEVSLDLARGSSTALFARGSLPMELRYFGARLLEDSLRGSIRTDSASFDIIEAFVPGARDATGTLVANIDVTGTWSHPDIAGALRVENGEVTLTDLGVRVRGVQVDLGLFGHSDSLAVRRLSGWTDAPSDLATIQGYIAYRDVANPYFDLRLAMRNFLAIDRRSLARLHVSTEPQNAIRLRGQLRGATLTGGLVVDRGEVYLPDPELARKRQVDISSALSDTAYERSDLMPKPPSRLMESLLLDSVRVSLGDEVWLRSREANIKLVGSLTVQRVRERRLTAGLGLTGDSVQYVPLLDGQLRAERGTYTLTAAAFQREFQVEGGTVTFLPIAGIEPELNISALHTVRTQSSSDLRIRVRLTGPLANPIVSLESAESFALSQSDLVSYLVFGRPNFELGTGENEATRLAMQQLFLSAPAFAQSQLRTILGSAADYITVSAAADASAVRGIDFLADAGIDYLLTTRVGAETQLTDRLYFSISTGICGLPLGTEEQYSTDFLDNLSGKIEWRFSRDASVRAGKEPSDLSLACGRGYGRVIRAPSQWGVSLFKTWRF